ncbi:uncharacterized protein MELLADRAFT_89522 [Melampsora larici-populina 98AG31]|uniref:Uncharacterized protein n=1 Tax=Melampsora larici-populina (strain 98AG31 / pathotype 3-4-7) TaxID=747676 RepID=F4RTN5_MELLP|nr:uncharacterized protein MELLADRAFT_89522 [Melampsora larici-populina 98AG31]EGG04289.1 hypothetical protein MELLADRAFT_89522 [Melampsora larici-populina 98AG31]
MVQYQKTYDERDDQKDFPIAPRLTAHKENVLQLQEDNLGMWTPSMQYDIAHRRNVWEHRMPDGSMADVGTLNKTLAAQALRDAKHHGEDIFGDKPYMLPGEWQHVNPITGRIHAADEPWDDEAFSGQSQAAMQTGRLVSHLATPTIPNLPDHCMAAITPAKSATAPSWFKGKNWDPNYVKPIPPPIQYEQRGGFANLNNSNTYHNNRPNPYANQNNARASGSGSGNGLCPALGPGSFVRGLGVNKSGAVNQKNNDVSTK